MAWESSRPVPWQRLIREWLIYIAIATVVLTIYRTQVEDKPLEPGLFAGMLASGPLYLVFGGVLAKFGYQRKTYKEMKAQRTQVAPRRAAASSARPVRPAPTKRTSTGPSQRPQRQRSKRR